jgi:Mrp family chromosome partitioning ATPase
MLSRPSAESRNARSAGDAGAEPIEVQIVSRARPSSEKARPQTGMITLLAMTAAMLLGVAFVLARELLAMARSAPPGEAPRTQNGLVAAARETGLEASAPVETVGSVSILARRLAARGRGRAGFRTLVTAEAPQDGAGRLAIELARKLARLGCQTILLDWSLDGVGLAEELGVSPRLGVTDVLAGRASFEDVITRLAGSEAHVIAAGSSVAGTAAARDKDRVGMLLDALDDAYEHVLITGRRDDVRDLFTTIEGRIDAGVAIADDAGEPRRGNFLGFNVAGLEVFRYEPVGEEPVASLPTPRRALS